LISLSTIPARLDRLTLVGVALAGLYRLGVAWVLDGLEVTLVGSLGAVLPAVRCLSLSAGEIGASGLALHRRAPCSAHSFSEDSLTALDAKNSFFNDSCGLYVSDACDRVLLPITPGSQCVAGHGLGIGVNMPRSNSAIDELHSRAAARSREPVD